MVPVDGRKWTLMIVEITRHRDFCINGVYYIIYYFTLHSGPYQSNHDFVVFWNLGYNLLPILYYMGISTHNHPQPPPSPHNILEHSSHCITSDDISVDQLSLRSQFMSTNDVCFNLLY